MKLIYYCTFSIYNKGDQTDCSNYRVMNYIQNCIQYSSVDVNVEKITGKRQRKFRRNRSTSDQIFCIRLTVVKKEYNETTQDIYRL